MSTKRRERLQQLLTDIGVKNNNVNALFDAADRRGDGVNTSDEITQIKNLHKEIETLETEAAELRDVLGIQDAATKRQRDMEEPANHLPFHSGAVNNDGGAQGSSFKTIGESVLGDEHMQAFLKRFEKGVGMTQQRIDSPKVDVKTLIVGTSSPLINQDRKPIVDFAYQRPLTVRDLITVGETGADTVEYARLVSATNNAAPVAEAGATGDGTGAKPESAMSWELVTESVRTIAHWVAASNRALSDAAQLRTYIDNFLRYGLDEELEDQILTGTGAGQNFTGVLVAANTTAQAWDTDILKTTRKARTKVRTVGRARPTAWVFNPTDWETIDLLQDNEARYYYGGPMQLGNPTLWGLPVVESEGMTQGTAVVADWKMAVLWNRMETMISMTNSHSDFFVRNLIAILAEMRAAFGLIRPKAFVITDVAA
jgi:HK97 family phage major capsid protein